MTTLYQKSFAGGEISPSLYGRTDIVKYATGLRTMRNFILMRHGGATNRPGTRHVAEVKDSTKAVRLVEWVFNSDQTYILEFGDQYIRVILNGVVQKESAKTITDITAANPPVVTSASHGYSDGDEVYISGVVGMTEVNGRNFLVANKATNTFELQDLGGTNIDGTGYTAYSSAGTAEKIYEISTSYLEADLPRLQYFQSADVMTIVHPTYAPAELTRSAHTTWTLSNITFGSSIAAPTGLSGGAGIGYFWKITAVKDETYEESLPSVAEQDGDPSISDRTISWSSVSGAVEYNVYRARDNTNQTYGFVDISTHTTYIDKGLITPDNTDTPPVSRTIFNGADDYPATGAYIQQRRMFASSNNEPETVWGSQIGFFNNFNIEKPLQDDGTVTFTIAGRQVNEVRHVLDIGRMVALTASGEWILNGNAAGVITPIEINARQMSYNGCNYMRPLVIDSTALYVQARGSVVRDLRFNFESETYTGNDLTIFSSHLFDDYTLVDWAYQKVPHSNIWIARSDGKLLGLTYVPEHQLWGWHQHDLEGGVVENCAAVPEGNEDVLYLVVQRTIDGRSVRYIERFATRQIDDIEDSIFMDSALTYDGTNTAATTMTLSGGTDWTYTETLTLTASAAYFASTDVGNAIHLTDSAGDVIRFTIDTFSSTTVVTGRPHKTVPTTLRSTAVTTWAKAVDELTNLWHLEGEDVSVFADGFVVGSPNNASVVTYTVSDGAITLDRPYSVIHVGLPYTSDIQTLNIDPPTDIGSTINRRKNISQVSMHLEDSRGIWVGAKPPSDDTTDPLENLVELKIRDSEDYDSPVSLTTDTVSINIKPEWNSNGRIFVRQVDPIPLSVLSIAPSGLIPIGR